jgi:hypothetical protein
MTSSPVVLLIARIFHLLTAPFISTGLDLADGLVFRIPLTSEEILLGTLPSAILKLLSPEADALQTRSARMHARLDIKSLNGLSPRVALASPSVVSTATAMENLS